MKKMLKKGVVLFTALFGMLVSAILAMAEPKAADAYMVEVEKGYLALRSEPAYDSKNELEALHTGDIFYVMWDYDSTYVYGFSETGKEGYVNKNYLTEPYNIASGITIRTSEGESWIETDYFKLYLPADLRWEYEVVDNTTISIYYTPAKEDDFGGHVVTLKAYDWTDEEYAEFPAWSVAGLSSEKKFIAVYPTDVQFNPDDSAQALEYGRLLEAAERMDCEDEELAKDNPFEVLE